MRAEDLEKYSSAVTLSDMEVFVFPELAHSLILANIMSPIIWQWRQQDWFRKLEGKSSSKKLMRLRQFIMDEYEFNLDLETWGLTNRQKELERFKNHLSAEQIAESNALFGYEGDKYYFDVDIRHHFGLDKYNSDVIPYWKTETVEAMNAFRRKANFTTGAGECVSLSTLYAAAAFIMCGIGLEDIFMVLTPLHSQNFIDMDEGVLTNNRRLITKTMWFNGTAISNKAQRALRHERVTAVTHNTGYVHCIYRDATIERGEYERFAGRLREFLSAELDFAMFANFLRSRSKYQKYFQLCRDCHGSAEFIKAEVLFNYEHNSNYNISDRTIEKLLAEISEEDFECYALPGRVRCDQLCDFLKARKPDLRTSEGRGAMAEFLGKTVAEAGKMVEDLADFLYIEPKLPEGEKNYVGSKPIELKTEWSREEVIEYMEAIRGTNTTADLAFYAYRDMGRCEWEPFVKAAVERSPVSIEVTKGKGVEQVYNWLRTLGEESIYDGRRLAQPDEVANFLTGDGLEKAFLLANVIRSRGAGTAIEIEADGREVEVKAGGRWRFSSSKDLHKRISVTPEGAGAGQEELKR